GVGVYYDENGKLPILRCVRAAEQMLIEAAKPRGYLPIDGIAAYDAATQALVFGAEHPARKAGRIATVQAVGGTGGLKVGTDPYYDPVKKDVDFAAMRATLEAAAPGTIVVLHACCHNPTGCDLSAAQWRELVPLLAARGLVPFLDMAYQGFGDGVAEDGLAVGLCVDAGLDCLVATSFSKSFSLYGERVGALSVG